MGNATFEYHKLLHYILDNGKKKTDRTGTGTTSIFDYKIKFDMEQGFPLITTKRLHTKSIVHELLWFLKGSTNIKYLNDNGVTIWDEWADENGDLGPVYGKQWVNWEDSSDVYGTVDGFVDGFKSINQIQNAIDTLKNNPDSRRIMVVAYNVGEIDQMALPPCHWAFELYTEELKIQERMDWLNKKNNTDERYRTSTLDEHNVPTRRLHMKFHMRSNDVFLGNPYNVACYALLLHMFAQQTNMVPGTLVADLTNVHIYNNHMDYVIEQLGRDSNKYSTPTLKLKKAKDIFSYTYEDFEIIDYETYPNWKNVPIAI